jgi:hypothetical protein
MATGDRLSAELGGLAENSKKLRVRPLKAFVLNT